MCVCIAEVFPWGLSHDIYFQKGKSLAQAFFLVFLQLLFHIAELNQRALLDPHDNWALISPEPSLKIAVCLFHVRHSLAKEFQYDGVNQGERAAALEATEEQHQPRREPERTGVLWSGACKKSYLICLAGHKRYGYVQHSLANGPCYIQSAVRRGQGGDGGSWSAMKNGSTCCSISWRVDLRRNTAAPAEPREGRVNCGGDGE